MNEDNLNKSIGGLVQTADRKTELLQKLEAENIISATQLEQGIKSIQEELEYQISQLDLDNVIL